MLDSDCNTFEAKKVHNSGNLSGRDINITNNYRNSNSLLMEEIPTNVDGYIYRMEEKTKLLSLISSSDIVQVYGISGVGKTELIQDIANEIKNHYSKSYFISSYNEEIDLTEVFSFSGTTLNLLDQVQTNKTLIIIDNYNYTIDKLVQAFRQKNKNDSKLIITSPIKCSGNISTYPLEFMTLEEAQQLFKDCTEADNPNLQDFLKRVDKHPMMLQVLKNYINDKDNGLDFSDFENDLFSMVKLEDDTKSQSNRICELIVGRYQRSLSESFELLKYINSNYIDKKFFKAIMKHDIPSLTKRMLIKSKEDHYYIHDIIKESINAVTQIQSDIIPQKDKILSYLKTYIESKLVDYYQFIAYNANLINKLLGDVTEQKDKVILYNLIVTYTNHSNLDSHVKNIESILNQHVNEEYKDYFEVKLYLEMLEMKIQLVSDNEKSPLIKEIISKLNEAIAQHNDNKIKNLINHHIGKLYNWLEDYDKAVNIFKDILDIDNKSYKTILQLCRSYRNLALTAEKENNREVALQHINKVNMLLKPIDFEEIPVSVYLEILTLIRNRPLNNKNILEICLWNRFDYFSRIAFLYSKNKVIEHIYITIGDLASELSYRKPDFFKEWFKNIEHPSFKESNSKIIDPLMNIYVAEIKRRRFSHDNESYKELVISVMQLWNNTKNKIPVDMIRQRKEFKYKPIIEMLLKIGEYKRAEHELNEIFRDDNEWHRRYRADIFKSKTMYKDAETELQEAIQICKQNDQTKYLSVFYNDLAEVYKCYQDPKCIESLKKAIELCDNRKTKLTWESKLSKWQIL